MHVLADFLGDQMQKGIGLELCGFIWISLFTKNSGSILAYDLEGAFIAFWHGGMDVSRIFFSIFLLGRLGKACLELRERALREVHADGLLQVRGHLYQGDAGPKNAF